MAFKLTTQREREIETSKCISQESRVGCNGRKITLKAERGRHFSFYFSTYKVCPYICKPQKNTQGPNYANNELETVHNLMLTWPYSLTVSKPTIPRSRSLDINLRTMSFSRWNQTSKSASCRTHGY